MWYIKDHLGNETGPFTFDELNSQLSQPALRENATLIKSGEQGAWKPALIALPDLFNDPLDDSVLDCNRLVMVDSHSRQVWIHCAKCVNPVDANVHLVLQEQPNLFLSAHQRKEG